MKLAVVCNRKSTNMTFHEVFTLPPSVLTTPDDALPALRQMIETLDPDIEVMWAEEVIDVKRGFYQ